MTIVLEINRPFQIRPGVYRSSVTVIRVWWLWFAVTVYKMRLDEFLSNAMDGKYGWEKKKA